MSLLENKYIKKKKRKCLAFKLCWILLHCYFQRILKSQGNVKSVKLVLKLFLNWLLVSFWGGTEVGKIGVVGMRGGGIWVGCVETSKLSKKSSARVSADLGLCCGTSIKLWTEGWTEEGWGASPCFLLPLRDAGGGGRNTGFWQPLFSGGVWNFFTVVFGVGGFGGAHLTEFLLMGWAVGFVAAFGGGGGGAFRLFFCRFGGCGGAAVIWKFTFKFIYVIKFEACRTLFFRVLS